MDVPASLQDFSLTRGGPLFKVEHRLHLDTPGRVFLVHYVLAALLLGWLPLFPLAAVEGGAAAVNSLLRDVHVHVLLLIALPVLLAAEPLVDGRLSLALRQFAASDLVGVGSLRGLERAALTVMRWRDLVSVELGLLVVSFALAWVGQPRMHGVWLLSDGHPTLAGAWYLFLCRPLFIFVLLRWLWRGALWFVFLFRVSRLPLILVSTHPDSAGGLGFLCVAQASFSPIVFAVACVLATSMYRTKQLDLTQGLYSYASPLVVLALIALSLLYLPLAFFSRSLLRTKRRGDLRFSALAAHHSRRFERKWFGHERENRAEMLHAEDFSALTDLGTSFQLSRDMRIIPWHRRSVFIILGSAMAPLALLLVVDRQFIAVVRELVKNLLF
ncbi:hypothetical protein P2318_31040 [Myxococcaceae bacterium GXIMD 01537]